MVILGMIDDNDDDEVSIPISQVKKAILEKILEFCKHCDKNGPPAEIAKPLKSNNMADLTNEYYTNYIDVDQELLFELILAANFLDIKPLLQLCCVKAACAVKDKDIPDVRNYFGIENDFSAEEEEWIKHENECAKESF